MQTGRKNKLKDFSLKICTFKFFFLTLQRESNIGSSL